MAQSKERKGSNFESQNSGAIVQKPERPNTYDSKIAGNSHLATMHLRQRLRVAERDSPLRIGRRQARGRQDLVGALHFSLWETSVFLRVQKGH